MSWVLMLALTTPPPPPAAACKAVCWQHGYGQDADYHHAAPDATVGVSAHTL
jgi:hypothetical protein